MFSLSSSTHSFLKAECWEVSFPPTLLLFWYLYLILNQEMKAKLSAEVKRQRNSWRFQLRPGWHVVKNSESSCKKVNRNDIQEAQGGAVEDRTGQEQIKVLPGYIYKASIWPCPVVPSEPASACQYGCKCSWRLPSVADVFGIVHSHSSWISDRNSLQRVVKSYRLWSIPLLWLFLHLLMITCSTKSTFDLILTRPAHSSFANY